MSVAVRPPVLVLIWDCVLCVVSLSRTSLSAIGWFLLLHSTHRIKWVDLHQSVYRMV